MEFKSFEHVSRDHYIGDATMDDGFAVKRRVRGPLIHALPRFETTIKGIMTRPFGMQADEVYGGAVQLMDSREIAARAPGAWRQVGRLSVAKVLQYIRTEAIANEVFSDIASKLVVYPESVPTAGLMLAARLSDSRILFQQRACILAAIGVIGPETQAMPFEPVMPIAFFHKLTPPDQIQALIDDFTPQEVTIDPAGYLCSPRRAKWGRGRRRYQS